MKGASKTLFLALSLTLITVVHYTTRTDDPHIYFVHVIFANLYLVPIVFSAYWFGLLGGLLVAAASVILYAPHVILQWPGSAMDRASQAGTMALFLLVGLAAGHLSSMEKRERLRAERAEARSQRRAIATAITTLEQALKVRDSYTRKHSERTATLSMALAKRLGLHEAECEAIWLAALMHDVGKIGVRDDILLKPEQLTDKEMEMVRKHPVIAEQILKPIKGIEPVVAAVRAHHENYDGTGYPLGLKGEQIPFGAQVLAVADTFSALTDDRIYHRHEEVGEALRTMETMAGNKLNPRLFDEFKEMITETVSEVDSQQSYESGTHENRNG
ncbi:MAG: HD domain-containing protein [Candidatus Abyssobacteria bacterium SURF_17]|uniref:HD domain-containing protein n=1 Tax=Candidatus Abyssobacteria bacterium SURF_17 TaxID=2093361 RepID=A0A419F8W4_9BACT|nr:MAG: HD domain-containing protein [Candidatus Abyssubacteria bacterium SURF_17]